MKKVKFYVYTNSYNPPYTEEETFPDDVTEEELNDYLTETVMGYVNCYWEMED